MIQNDMCCLGVSMDGIEVCPRGHLVGVCWKQKVYPCNEDSEQINIINIIFLFFGSHACIYSLLPRAERGM